MPGDSTQQDWLSFGAAAALSKQYAADEQAFLGLVAQMLGTALPARTKVERRGGLLSKKTVKTVAVTLGENRYIIENPGSGSLRPQRARIVRGIALKTEDMSMEAWLNELGAALDEHAKADEAARAALSRFIGVS